MTKHIITRLIPIFILLAVYNFQTNSTAQAYLLVFVILISYVMSAIWWSIDAVIKYSKKEMEKTLFNLVLIILPIVYFIVSQFLHSI